MRVISGSAKGKRLLILDKKSVRPTIDRVKEAIFSSIQFEVKNKIFLDLFAGSGQMGIEALSRGAKKSIFIDHDKDSIKIIKENLNKAKFSEESKVFCCDSLYFLEKYNENFIIVFLDPPYNSGILQKSLLLIINKINLNGIIICESSQEESMPEKIGNFKDRKLYNYGKIFINIYRNIN